MNRRALVLAGGGYVASSWEIGLVTGMADRGLDVRNADLFVGTSAGARVAIDLASGKPLEEFYQRRLQPAGGPRSGGGTAIDWARIKDGVETAKSAGGDPAEILRRYGELALAVAPQASPDRREIVAAQLPITTWPEAHVLIAAIDVETGERTAFDRNSGIDLVDAIIATTASFGAAPMLFDGRYYIDGGYHSSDNADLAVGYDRVLILALRSPPQAMRLVSVEAGVAALRATGAQVELVHPDDATVSALESTGGQMNPASGAPAAAAGRVQGRRIAESIATFWR